MKKRTKKKTADAAPIGQVRRFLAILNAIRASDFPNKTSLAKECHELPRVGKSPADGNSIFSFPMVRIADEHLCGRFIPRKSCEQRIETGRSQFVYSLRK